MHPNAIRWSMVDDRDTRATRAGAGDETADDDLAAYCTTPPNDEASTGEATIIGVLTTSSYRVAVAGKRSLGTVFVLNTAGLFVFSRIASSFVLTPVVMTGVLLWFTANVEMMKRTWFVFVEILLVITNLGFILVSGWLAMS